SLQYHQRKDETLHVLAGLEPDGAGEHVQRLVLALVVLQAQGMPLADVEDLPHVTIGPRPDELVSPGLFDADGLDRRHVSGSASRLRPCAARAPRPCGIGWRSPCPERRRRAPGTRCPWARGSLRRRTA